MLNVKEKLDAFVALKDLVSIELDQVNSLILEHAKSQVVELIPTITEYITSSGGKRIRPILTLVAAKLFNPPEQNYHILLATAVEYIHTATLLHDDVIDESVIRRGKPSSNHKWGNKASILVGDYLFSQAFKLMVETKSLTALDTLAKSSVLITEGEVWQLLNVANLSLTEAEYLKVINNKTAILFAAACEAGALISQASKQEVQALYNYGLNLGMSYQIIDDILDYTASNHLFGKANGNDFKEGKVTLPFIIALKSPHLKAELITLIKDKDNAESFIKVANILKENNAFTQALEVADKYINAGIKSLDILPESEIKNKLIDLILELKSRVA